MKEGYSAYVIPRSNECCGVEIYAEPHTKQTIL